MDIISFLQHEDENLFKLVNSYLSVPWLDDIMTLLRNQYTWVPLYAFLLFWFYKKYKEQFLLIVFMSLITFALTDYISAGILKPWLARQRPCYEPGLEIRLLIECGGRYSMPSTHASNHFGLAMFWFCIVSAKFNKKWYWLWLWAFIICYAQVYVGKHYPGDILCGFILGLIIGYITSRLFRFLETYSLNRKKKFSLPVDKPH